MAYRRLAGRNAIVTALAVLGMTLIMLLLGAILLPPKDGNAMPRDGDVQAPVTSPR